MVGRYGVHQCVYDYWINAKDVADCNSKGEEEAGQCKDAIFGLTIGIDSATPDIDLSDLRYAMFDCEDEWNEPIMKLGGGVFDQMPLQDCYFCVMKDTCLPFLMWQKAWDKDGLKTGGFKLTKEGLLKTSWF